VRSRRYDCHEISTTYCHRGELLFFRNKNTPSPHPQNYTVRIMQNLFTRFTQDRNLQLAVSRTQSQVNSSSKPSKQINSNMTLTTKFVALYCRVLAPILFLSDRAMQRSANVKLCCLSSVDCRLYVTRVYYDKHSGNEDHSVSLKSSSE